MGAEDRDARAEADKERAEERRRKRRTQAVQRSLPRPSTVNGAMSARIPQNENGISAADALLAKEISDLVYFDAHGVVAKEEFDDERLEAARAMLDAECKRMRERMTKEETDLERDGAHCVFVLSAKRFEFVEETESERALEAAKQQFQVLYAQTMKGRERAENVKKRLKVRMAGYERVSGQLMSEQMAMREKLLEMSEEKRIYEELEQREAKVIPQRIKKWEVLIAREKKRHSELQKEYEELKREHDALIGAQT